MSLGQIFGTALSGLGASQEALRLTAANIANARTPGYARERVAAEPIVLSGRGAGVRLGVVERVADLRLDALVRTSGGEAGRAAAADTYLDRLQAAFGTPGSDASLTARLDAVAAAALRLSSAGGQIDRDVLLGAIGEATAGFQALGAETRALAADAADEASATVGRINGLLDRIAELNGDVRAARYAGRSSSGLENRRALALDELAGLVAVNVRPQPDGALHVESRSGIVLVDRQARQLRVPETSGGIPRPHYSAIEVTLSGASGAPLPTGERLDAASAGGRLGALLTLRDATLPGFAAELGALFEGVATAINAAANAGTAAPPPALLEGRVTGLAGDDALRLTGRATLLLTDADGRLTGKLALDFDAAGAPSTADELVAAINAALGPVASFADGRLSLANPGGGVALAADPAAPASRAGTGFSAFFGLNDLIRLPGVPGGLAAADPHGVAAGETIAITLRDASGRTLAAATIAPAAGGTIGDVVAAVGASDLGAYGTFGLSVTGRLTFAPAAGRDGIQLVVTGDGTRRHGQIPLSDMLGFGQVRTDRALAAASIAADGGSAPAGRANPDALIGEIVVGVADNRALQAIVDALAAPVRLGGPAGVDPPDGGRAATTLDRAVAELFGGTGATAAIARARAEDAAVRRDDAVRRRDSFAGVDVDEELAQLTLLQSSYAASARALAAAKDMLDDLLRIAA